MKKQKFHNKRQPKLKVLIWFDENQLDKLDPAQVTDDDRAVYKTLFLHPHHKEYSKEDPQTDHITQGEFARFIGVDEAQVSRWLAKHILTPHMPWRVWCVQIFSYWKGLAAGRRGSGY